MTITESFNQAQALPWQFPGGLQGIHAQGRRGVCLFFRLEGYQAKKFLKIDQYLLSTNVSLHGPGAWRRETQISKPPHIVPRWVFTSTTA